MGVFKVAGTLKPSSVTKEGKYVINSFFSGYNYPGVNKAEYLFNESTSSGFALYRENDYIDIWICDTCNIWTLGRSDIMDNPLYCGTLQVFKANEITGIWELTNIQDKKVTSTEWVKTYINMPAGRYKFVKPLDSNQPFRLDIEWCLEFISYGFEPPAPSLPLTSKIFHTYII